MKLNRIGMILMCALGLTACSQNGQPLDAEFSSVDEAIINGTLVQPNEYPSTVAIVLEAERAKAFCTGTLISPEWVLTAGHCIQHCQKTDSENPAEDQRGLMRVGIGNTESEMKTYKIDQFILHPNFCWDGKGVGNPGNRNDIALLHLKEKVARYVASPIQPMRPQLDFSSSDVASGVQVTSVGFGERVYDDASTTGTKYKTSYSVYAYCPLSGTDKSSTCGGTYTSEKGFIYINDPDTNTCKGDSGGPTFYTKDDMDFVVGVTSFGYGQCNGVTGMTHVGSYYNDFIAKHVTDLAAANKENCHNKVDDNGDGRIDCLDPWCYSDPQCVPENCENKKDDNGDGLVDCEDPECAGITICIPENCENGIDDNGDGRIDCSDPMCEGHEVCRDKENCYNDIDDDGNGLIDCKDPACAKALRCIPENCTNAKDDNGDGLIDCSDPQCSTSSACAKEICDNKIDDNNNGLIDCQDLQCASAPVCQPEICGNGIDDNENGKLDCDDPQCSADPICRKEICDDNTDNNGDGLVDCNDPECFDVCLSKNDDDCSANPMKPASSSAWILLLSLLGLAAARKRRFF